MSDDKARRAKKLARDQKKRRQKERSKNRRDGW